MSETQKLLITQCGNVYLMLVVEWESLRSWYEVQKVCNIEKYDAFADAVRAYNGLTSERQGEGGEK